ncbi:MAG: hypothetical protein R2939_06495 [Kofleriaceae bacterium]
MARVGCTAGDTAGAVIARAERALSALPGGLRRELAERAQLLIIDDAHHLDDGEQARLWEELVPGPTALGRAILAGRERPAVGRGAGVAELGVGALDPAAAAALWRALGGDPAAAETVHARSGGSPWGVRRAFASARMGGDAWDPSTLPADAAAVALALAVTGAPHGAVVLAALAQIDDASPALAELSARHLVDVDDDGRACLAAPAVSLVLAATGPVDRAAVGRRAAALLAGDAAADPRWALARAELAALDPIDRLRAAVRLSLACGDEDRARALVIATAPRMLRRGARGELEALVAGSPTACTRRSSACASSWRATPAASPRPPSWWRRRPSWSSRGWPPR